MTRYEVIYAYEKKNTNNGQKIKYKTHTQYN